MLDALLSPLRLGPVELRNRIVSTAHQTTLVHDHLPTDDFLAYHEARARGGEAISSRPPWKSWTKSFVPCGVTASTTRR